MTPKDHKRAPTKSPQRAPRGPQCSSEKHQQEPQESPVEGFNRAPKGASQYPQTSIIPNSSPRHNCSR
eukprot:5671263-Pyramimonas_sp.AAC.1